MDYETFGFGLSNSSLQISSIKTAITSIKKNSEIDMNGTLSPKRIF